MTLQFTRKEFIECETCRAKPGTPSLCIECLERRELHSLAYRISHHPLLLIKDIKMAEICPFCNGSPNLNCPEHGR